MDDRKILERYPLPIARIYRRYRNASEPRERHDAAYYLFEVYLKYVASSAIARYLEGERRDHRVNSALKGLARPSLGEWVRFLRECSRFLAESDEVDPVVRAIGDLLEGKEARWKAVVYLYNRFRALRSGESSEREKVHLAMLLEELVLYRNRVLGHGAPLSKDHYQEFGDLLGKAFVELLERSPFLTIQRLVVFEAPRVREGSRVECEVIEYMGDQPIRRDEPLSLPYGAPAPREKTLYLLGEAGDFLSLDPLLIARQEDVYVLNEAGGSSEYLSYSTGERHRLSSEEGTTQELFERILGYQVDGTHLSRISGDLASPADVADESPQAEEEIRRLGDYRLVREVGRGAMGAVFEAVQESLGRRVALKVLPGTIALDAKRLERFRREARATARIHHPNIVPVYDVGEAEGNHYYSMEYIDGPTLGETLARAREEAAGRVKGSSSAEPAHVANVVERMAAVAEGLEEAHRQGLVHRDVKPSNILVDSSGRYVLVDFGLVREMEAETLTRSGEMVGTLSYMSPEQVSRRQVDARSDVYSLGATLYEALTLEPPFRGKSEHEIQNAILFDELTSPRKYNPRLSHDLETILSRTLEKSPERRYSSAAELAADLRRFLEGEPIEARPLSTLTRITRRTWKHKGKVALAATLAVLLSVVVVSWIQSERRAQARAETLPRIREKIDLDEWDEAYALALEAEGVLGRADDLQGLFQEICRWTNIETTPPGARVFTKPYSNPEAQWEDRGLTPQEEFRLPRGYHSWKIEKVGYPTFEFHHGGKSSIHVSLVAIKETPPGMVYVPEVVMSSLPLGLTGGIRPVPVGDFYIDRHEVTNREFKEFFVDKGGYSNRAWWKEAIEQSKASFVEM